MNQKEINNKNIIFSSIFSYSTLPIIFFLAGWRWGTINSEYFEKYWKTDLLMFSVCLVIGLLIGVFISALLIFINKALKIKPVFTLLFFTVLASCLFYLSINDPIDYLVILVLFYYFLAYIIFSKFIFPIQKKVFFVRVIYSILSCLILLVLLFITCSALGFSSFNFATKF